MNNEKKNYSEITTQQLKNELKRVKNKSVYFKTLRSTILILVFVASVAVLLSAEFFPVMRVVGTSMEPTLENGQIAVAVKTTNFEQGDVVAFYYNSKILIKRVIALSGDYVDIDTEGNVYVNDRMLNETYITVKSAGDGDITFPYQVPDNRIFVMGDNRSTSIDSRSSDIGCISEEFIVGKIIIWFMLN